MIQLDQFMIKYRKAVLKHNYKKAFEASIEMQKAVSEITDFTFGKLNEIQSRKESN